MKPGENLRDSWRRRFDFWLARRRPEIRKACRLSHRRLYIIPTATGLFFVLVLLLILVGAANFGSSMAFILVFLLVGVGINAIWLTHANLLGLIIEPLALIPAFAGEEVALRLRLENPQDRLRPALKWSWLDEPEAPVLSQIKSLSSDNVSLTKIVRQRGWFTLPPIRLGSSWPLGLFYVWTIFRPSEKILVYPQPARSGLPLPLSAHAGGEKPQPVGQTQVSGNDDFAGLRPYRIGDSPGRLDWRARARGGELQAREFHGSSADRLLFDWWQLHESGVEARLSQLCRWVLDAEVAGYDYGLRLPGQDIEPGQGPQHRHQVLTALALFKVS
ncbi:MAG: DUF58 domain-containing protein [Deltaproteobacteria bacterium]|nr:DUF58 domain-containing protein [Deltaproteobacteria bacterium]